METPFDDRPRQMIVDPVAAYAKSTPNAPAVVDLESGRRWTYATLDRAINRAARWIVERYGPKSGARIATLARNAGDIVILQLACVRAGAIFTPFNWRLAPAEIAVLIEDADPSAIFRDREFPLPDYDGEVFELAALEEITGGCSDAPPTDTRRAFGEVSTLLYTSGTSGRPKGVMLSEENAFWGCTNFILGNGVSRRSVFLCDMPLFHTAGLYAATRTPILAGGTVLISKGFDAEKTLARIADPGNGVTHYFSVPQMAQMLRSQPGFDPEMLRGLEVWAVGGAPNPAAQVARFAREGIRMSDGFGMSETGSNFGMPVDNMALVIAKAGSCGLPYMALEARIVDEEGRDVAEGETGELWLKGPGVTKGYWNQPEKTAEAFHDGWFKTGDAAYRDEDGFYFLVDRKKDMFISGGENVYPAEVEAAIAELDAVAEAAVIGVADERWGEVGRAYVIAAAGATITADEILDHCRARLAKYKTPKTVVVTDNIPRTASGKVQKHLLKARAEKEMAR